MEKKNASDVTIMIGGISCLITCCLLTSSYSMFALMKLKEQDVLGINFAEVSNIVFYVISCIIYLLIYVAAYCGIDRINRHNPEIIHHLGAFCIWMQSLIILFIFALGFIYQLYKTNGESAFILNVFRKNISFLFAFSIIILITVFMKSFIINFKLSNKQRVIYIWMASIVMYIFCYIPNMFMGDIYHYHAYSNSIYNVLAGAPYNSCITTSIYGHYGLIIALIANLCGGGTAGVVVTIGIIGFLTIYLICKVLNKLIKNDMIFLLGVTTMLFPVIVLYRPGMYLQMIPHRYFFTAVLLYFITCSTLKGKLFEICGYLICMMAILWNTETGISILLGYTIFLFVRTITRLNKYKLCLRLVFDFAMTFLCAYAVVGVYNLLAGGSFGTVLDFVYPIGSKVYLISELESKLHPYQLMYVLIVVLFLMIIANTLLKLIFNKSISKTDSIMVCAAVIGAGKFTYYINRPAYANISIVLLEIFLIIACILEFIYKCYGNKEIISSGKLCVSKIKIYLFNYKCAIGSIFMVLFMLQVYYAMATVSYFGVKFYNFLPLWNTEKLQVFLEDVDETIPENTYAFGNLTHEIFGYINRDTRSYTIDFSDINEAAYNRINEELKKENSCFVSVKRMPEDYTDKIPELSNFELQKWVEYMDETGYLKFGYYVRR